MTLQLSEERWLRLVDEVGLANATRLIMAENPGKGDSVQEQRNIWGNKSALQIAILLEKPVELWSEVRAGANAFDDLFALLPEVQPSVTRNSWLSIQELESLITKTLGVKTQ